MRRKIRGKIRRKFRRQIRRKIHHKICREIRFGTDKRFLGAEHGFSAKTN